MLVASLFAVGLSACSQTNYSPWTLAGHVYEQLASRTNGTADYTGPRNPANFFTEPPRLAPHFWLADVTNILAGSQGQMAGKYILSCADYMTPITPHLCVVNWHTVTAPDAFRGRANIWLRPDGTLYTNVSLLATNVLGDLGLIVMANTNWTTVKILPDISAKVGAWTSGDFRKNLAPLAVRFHLGIGNTNRFHTTFVSGMVNQGTIGGVPLPLAFGNYSFGENWVSGDSSGPAYLVIHNEAVLIGQVYTARTIVPLGTCARQLVEAAAAFCRQSGLPVETPVFYDVSEFPDE